MASEFEQTKREVSGRSVMITSWFDVKTSAWRASAPSYAGLASCPSNEDVEQCKSRQVAIDKMVHVLVRHFATKQTISVDTVIFL